MTKYEFIDGLKVALNGKISPSQVIDNTKFYENYINTEIQKGRAEAEVLEMLGNPRLIAKTIVQTSDIAEDNIEESGYRNVNSDESEAWNKHNNSRSTSQGNTLKKRSGLFMVVWIFIIIALVIMLFSGIISIIAFIMPLVLPFFVIFILVKLFRDWLK